jgi:hypothetical protein
MIFSTLLFIPGKTIQVNRIVLCVGSFSTNRAAMAVYR